MTFGCRKQNADFWLVCIAYSMSVSIYGVWSSLFGVLLKDVMHEVRYHHHHHQLLQQQQQRLILLCVLQVEHNELN